MSIANYIICIVTGIKYLDLELKDFSCKISICLVPDFLGNACLIDLIDILGMGLAFAKPFLLTFFCFISFHFFVLFVYFLNSGLIGS